MLRKKISKALESSKSSTWLWPKKSRCIHLCLPSKACPQNWICDIVPIKWSSSSWSLGPASSYLSPFHNFLCQFHIGFGVFWAALDPSTDRHFISATKHLCSHGKQKQPSVRKQSRLSAGCHAKSETEKRGIVSFTLISPWVWKTCHMQFPLQRSPGFHEKQEWVEESGIQKIIQTRNFGQFQVCLFSIGIKRILNTVLQDQEKIIHYKIHQDSKVTFSD